MSTDDLRRELDRISESAPHVYLAHDTWARARRSAVRDRVSVGGVALAVVAAVAIGVTWLPDRLDPPVADTRSLALPDHLYSVPDWMSDRENDGSWSRGEVSDDLDIGVGAAAWVTKWGLPVVVGAVDGDYHLMDLPGFGGNNAMMGLRGYTPTIALSPDGNLLAYSWATFGPDLDTGPISSGVRIADLTTGEVREFAVEGEEGTAVMAIAWSDDSRWIGWEGSQPGSWTKESMSSLCGECAVAGRIDLVSGDSSIFNPEDIDATDASVAVDDSGVVSVIANGFVTRWDGTTQRRLDDFDAWLPLEATSIPSDESGRVVLSGSLGYSFVVLDGDKAEEVDLGAPDDEWWELIPLGWFGDRVLARTDALDRDRGGELRRGDELRLIPLDGGPGTKVGVVDAGTQSLTVAYRLLDAEHLTVERPKPDWPWSDKRWSITIGLGVAAAWAVMILLRRSFRRYRAAR